MKSIRTLSFLFLALCLASSAWGGTERRVLNGTLPSFESGGSIYEAPGASALIQRIDSLALQTLPSSGTMHTPTHLLTQTGDSPTITPDGLRVVCLLHDDTLWSVPAAGGAPVQLADEGAVDDFLVTADSQNVVFSRGGLLYSVPAAGGSITALLPVLWQAAGGSVSNFKIIPGTGRVLIEGRESATAAEQLYRVNAATGGSFMQLTSVALDINEVQVSASGAWAVFRHESKESLSSVNLTGTPVQAALDGSYEVSSYSRLDFVISPDSSTVFFVDLEVAHDPERIYRRAIDGTGSIQVVSGSEGDNITDLSVSTDGSYLIYVSSSDSVALPAAGGTPVLIPAVSGALIGAAHMLVLDDTDGDGRSDLVCASLATGTVVQISSPSMSGRDATWDMRQFSVDGASVLYRFDEVVSGRYDVFRVALDGTGKVNLSSALSTPADGINDDILLLQDGSAVVYEWDGVLYKNALSGPVLAVQLTVPTTRSSSASDLVISPDGNHVVWQEEAVTTAGSTTALYVGAADGSVRRQVYVPTRFAYYYDFSFTPDGAWLLYRVTESVASLRGHRLADGLNVVLSANITSLFEYFISPDSSHVSYYLEYDLYTAPLDGSTNTWTNLTAALDDIDDYPVRSPDGAHMLVGIISGPMTLLALDGSGVVAQFGSYSWEPAEPVFSTDGTQICFTEDDGQKLRLHTLATSVTDTLLTLTGDAAIQQLALIGGYVFAEVEEADVWRLISIKLSTGSLTTLTADSSTDIEWTAHSNGASLVALTTEGGMQVLGTYHPQTTGTVGIHNAPLSTSQEVREFRIVEDASAVVFRADRDVDDEFRLYLTNLINGTTFVPGTPAAAGFEDVEGDWQVTENGSLLYRSDIGHAGTYRLYRRFLSIPITQEANPTAMPISRGVSEFVVGADSERVAFLSNIISADTWEVHTAWGEPDVSPISNQSSIINTDFGPLSFSVNDWESVGRLQITVQSSNAGLLDPNNAVLGGSGTSCTLTLTPNTDAWGRTLVTLLVSDGSFTTPRQFTWTVTPDANDVPSNIALAPASIQENQPAGTLVGYLSATDADAWDIHSYSLVSGSGDGDNHLFLIDGGALRATVPYDFEARSAFSIRVRVTDFVGATFEKVLFVSVLDLRGISQPVTLTTREGMGRFLDAQDFIDRFTLQDGGSLTKIRIESAPMNGSLNYQLGRRHIDTAANAAQALATGDVNGDGRPDIIAVLPGSGDLVWYENGGGASPTFTRRHIASVLNQPRDVAVGDVDKDGDLDVFVAEHGANKILCFRGSGGSAPTFAPITVFSGAGGLSSLTTADIDGDTDLDVISTHPLGHRVMIHRNDGAATPGFIGSVLSTTETGAADAVVFDVDLDGDLDIVSAAATSGDVAWFEQNGASFTRRAIATGLPQPSSLARADINGDSRSDLVIATSGDNSVNWYQNIPPATSGAALAFMPNLVSSSLAGVTNVLATDFTGDNVPDIIACSPVDGRILGFQTFRGASVGFATHQLDKNAAGAAAVASTDFTANGRPDLVACHASANTIAWYQDERLLIGGDEVTVHELHKIRYQPHMSFTGDDALGWRGHDGVQWSFHPSVVTLKVIAGDYWDWLVDAFGVESVSDFSESVTTWGDSADADGDGRSNLLEYAFGGDPTSGSDSGDAVATAPQTETDGTTYFHLSFIMRHSDPDLIYTPEVTADFKTWNSGPTYFQHVAPDVVLDADFTQVTYRYLVPVSSGSPAGFFRVKVERAP